MGGVSPVIGRVAAIYLPFCKSCGHRTKARKRKNIPKNINVCVLLEGTVEGCVGGTLEGTVEGYIGSTSEGTAEWYVRGDSADE